MTTRGVPIIKPLIAIHMARKPLIGTVAANATKHGTGGLNIDASRIGTKDGLNGGAYAMNPHPRLNPEEWRYKRGGARSKLPGDDREGAAAGMYQPGSQIDSGFKQPPGRWPANIILDHKESCRQVGIKLVRPIGGSGRAGPGGHGFQTEYVGGDQKNEGFIGGFVDDDGLEAIPSWVCHPGCPVADLDEHVGVKTSGVMTGDHRGFGRHGIYGVAGTTPAITYGDSGGASRYFKQVQGEDALIAYLRTMISTPRETAFYISDLDGHYTVSGHWEPESICGFIVRGAPTEDQVAMLKGQLRPGGHILLIAPDEQPTGHTGAIRLEDGGFEIRDCILWVRGAGRTHYVAKAPRSEREAGCAHLKGKAGHEAVERKEGSAGVQNPRAGAGRTAQHVRNFHPCLHPDAVVMTEQGYRPISGMRWGDMVYGMDGQFHPVDDVSHHPYGSTHLHEIAVQGTNYTTPASDNHPFLIWRPTRSGKRIMGGEVGWVTADDICKGDYTMTPILADVETASRFDEDYWWVFGLWLAEGVLQRAGHGTNVYPSFTLHRDETALLERLRDFFEGRGVNLGVYPKPGSKAVQVMGFDPGVGKQFGEWSPCGASNKRLPIIIWWRQSKYRRAVFEGYMAGDGGRVRTYRQAKTVSPDLASQVRLLGESLGTKANLFRYEAQPGGVGDRKFKTTLPSYQVRFYDRDMNQTDRKPARPTLLEHEGVTYRLAYVQKVTPVVYEGDVWNITVKDCPTFQTAVGMSHNTVKPIALMERLLGDVPKDATVLDPFLGSGTTAIACSKTGHSFVGIEKSAEYLEIADTRVRHWDSAHHGWQGAKIESDHVQPAEHPPDVTMGDLFGWEG